MISPVQSAVPLLSTTTYDFKKAAWWLAIFLDSFWFYQRPSISGNAVESRSHGSPRSPEIRQHSALLIWNSSAINSFMLGVRYEPCVWLSTALPDLIHCVPFSTVFFQEPATRSKINRFSKFLHRVTTNALTFVSKA